MWQAGILWPSTGFSDWLIAIEHRQALLSAAISRQNILIALSRRGRGCCEEAIRWEGPQGNDPFSDTFSGLSPRMDTWDEARGFGKPSIWWGFSLPACLSFVLNFTRHSIRDYGVYDHISQSWCNKTKKIKTPKNINDLNQGNRTEMNPFYIVVRFPQPGNKFPLCVCVWWRMEDRSD